MNVKNAVTKEIKNKRKMERKEKRRKLKSREKNVQTVMKILKRNILIKNIVV